MNPLSCDGFLGGRLRIWQPLKGYRGGTDPVLVAAACPAGAGDRVLDLGCGTGIAALCLAARVRGAVLTGVEISRTYAALARRSASENRADLTVIDGDIAALPAQVRHTVFDHVICNPPYFKSATRMQAADPSKERALSSPLPLATWIDQAVRRIRPKGTVTLIVRTDRLLDVLAPCHPRLGCLRLLPIAGRACTPASRVLFQGTKGARGPMQILSPLVMHTGHAHLHDGDTLSPAAQSILRDGAALRLRCGDGLSGPAWIGRQGGDSFT